MTWYYALNNQQNGPIEQVELERLLQQGVINAETLVWREGMANWQPYAQALSPAPSVSTAPPVLGGGGVVCSECGRMFAADEVIKLGNGFVCASCKPIATQKLSEGVLYVGGAEQIRKDHIKHEASVKSVGVLYYLGAIGLGLVGTVFFFGVGFMPRGGGAARLEMPLLAIFFLVLGGLQGWVGFGLRRLRPWARIPSGILAGIGLLGFPVGTLINAYILYLLFSKKGTMVFSEDYQEVMRQTPHIKYRTSIVVWVVLGLLLLLIGFVIVAALSTRLR
jgi:hypothetical protein